MRNRRYETVFILSPDLEEGKKKEILDRLDGVVEKGGGIRVKREDWGVRRLAYPVKHHPKGHYYLLDFVGSAQIVAELERHMRMIENVSRFLTVKTDDRVDLEAAQKEQAEEKEKEEAREVAFREEAREAALREEAREAALKEEAAAQAAAAADEPASSEAPAEGTEAEEEAGQEAEEEAGQEAEEEAGEEGEEEGEEEKREV